jgi:DNA polymerase-3 subunit delta'
LNIIYISNDIEKAKEEIVDKYENIYIFEDIDLKLELVKSIKEEAYKTTEKEKYILIKAINFRIESQNALLKILEETPDRVNFIILTTSKYALLDTIKSRMSIKIINYNLPKIEFNLNINRLTTKDIYETLKKPLDKQELKSFIYEVFKNIQNPNKELLEDFELAIKLVDLNTDRQAIISLLLLSIRNLNANLQNFK